LSCCNPSFIINPDTIDLLIRRLIADSWLDQSTRIVRNHTIIADLLDRTILIVNLTIKKGLICIVSVDIGYWFRYIVSADSVIAFIDMRTV